MISRLVFRQFQQLARLPGTFQRNKMSTDILNANIAETDPELFEIMRKEKERQVKGIELIASENFTSLSVQQCLGSCLTNKYSEGMPGYRYYGGNEYIDDIERLAQKRSLEAFHLNPDEWGVNVQLLSGSPANFAAYTGLVQPHGRIMGLDLPHGGHLTHGFFTAQKKISATSVFFESMPYRVNPETGLIDYDALLHTARLFKPKLIIAGVTCYSRVLDYKRFREICDDVGAYLMSDMAHISGLVAAGVTPSPFDYSDIVTSTTHKSLRGPRAGVIFYRRGNKCPNAKGETVPYDLEDKINQAVFPALFGGPHNNKIAAIATVMKQAQHPDFIKYQKQVIANAKRLCSALESKGYHVVTGGTDVHMLLVDMRSVKLTGAKAEYVLEQVSIVCNKNTVPGDKSAMNPSGVRLGSPAMTTRGLVETDIDQIVEYMDRALKLAIEASAKSGPKLPDFKNVLKTDPDFKAKIDSIKNEVEAFAKKFPMPGHDCY